MDVWTKRTSLLLIGLVTALMADARVMRVLAIGNSFSEDAVEQYLYELALPFGDTLVIGNAYRPGQGLKSHWKALANGDTNYSYRKIVDGVKQVREADLLACITDEPWDYVTFQQASYDSGLKGSFEPWLSQLIALVKEKSTNKAVRMGFHQTWAYAADASHPSFVRYERSQRRMYDSIRVVSRWVMASHAADLTFLIPSGTAIQNMRSTYLADTMCRDGYHLSLGLGRYVAACTWLEVLTGHRADIHPLSSALFSAGEAVLAARCAHRAVLTPYAMTPDSLAGDADGRDRLQSLRLSVSPADADGVFIHPQPVELEIELANPSSAGWEGGLSYEIRTDMDSLLVERTVAVELDAADTCRLMVGFEPPFPGFFRLVVRAAWGDMQGMPSSFVFGCDPERLCSPANPPADFKAFWQQTLDELASVKPAYRLTLLPEQSSDVKNMYHVEMQSWGDVSIEGYYCVPKQTGRYPAVVAYMGYGVKPYFPDARAMPDFCEFVLSVRGQGIQRERNPYGDWAVYGLESAASYYYRGAYMDLIRAIDFVASRPEVDAGRIAVEGGSQGGAFSLVAAALDKRVRCAAPHIPFLTDFPDYFRLAPWPRSAFAAYLEKHPLSTWADVYRVLAYFDVKNFAAAVTCPVVMGIGLQDPICPPHTNFASYNLLGGPKEYHVYLRQKHSVAQAWWPMREAFFRRVLGCP